MTLPSTLSALEVAPTSGNSVKQFVVRRGGAVVCGMFLLACVLPAVHFSDGPAACTSFRPSGTILGLGALLLGWLPPYTSAWPANPTLLGGLIALQRRTNRVAFRLGLVAAALALTTYPVVLWGGGRYPHVGYLVWQLAPVVLAMTAQLRQRVPETTTILA